MRPAKTKIAIVVPLAEQRGGGELMVLHLLQEGRHLGVEWLVIFLADGPMVGQVREMGVEARVIVAGRLREIPRFLCTVAEIARLARRENVQLIFGWMNQGQLYGAPAAKLAGLPSAWYQLGIAQTPGWNDRIATALPAHVIVACSQAGADAQARILPKRPLRVVCPGVELARFDPACLPVPQEARQRLGLSRTGPIIGIVGRLQRWKGMHVLIEAMPEILRGNPLAHCIVVGGEHALEPDYAAFLRALIRDLALDKQVTLAGLQHNVPEWMQAMDVVVHASDHEPFGIVVIEAMALGKPVVAGDAAGPTEIITDGVDGLLSPYGDAPALAQAVLRVLSDTAYAAGLGAAARRRALEFSTQRYAQELTCALQSVLPCPSKREERT